MKSVVYFHSSMPPSRLRVVLSLLPAILVAGIPGAAAFASPSGEEDLSGAMVFARVEGHAFHPLNEEQTFTHDRILDLPGIADPDDADWRVRLLAVRDLVRLGVEEAGTIAEGLSHPNKHVRQASAMALGLLRAESVRPRLEELARKDTIAMVRSQAVIALGQMEATASLPLLRELWREDESGDVRHQSYLAIGQIEKRMGTTPAHLTTFQGLDEATFESVRVGEFAPDFELEDTEGNFWKLSDFRGKQWVALIWVFADWCPVCHKEFRDLIGMRAAYELEGVQVLTLECHDRFRGRVMVGKEVEPEYWFSKRSFREVYTEQIWWPHLLDRAGAVGARYGVDPLAFAVHAEYINRPSTVIVDPEGMVRFAYYGTYWGDRPKIEEILDMIKHRRFTFEHPKRREVAE